MNPRIVPYASKPHATDLSRNHEVAQVAVFLARQFFALDLAKVEFSGIADHCGAERPGSLTVSLWESGAESAFRHITIAGRLNGFVDVRATAGPIKEAVGFDLLGELQALWNEVRGLPQSLPMWTATRISPCGALAVELHPLI